MSRAPGSTVLRMVANRMHLMNIEVETDWHGEDIRALAEEEGYAFDEATGRFHKGDPTPAEAAVMVVTKAAELPKPPPALAAVPEPAPINVGTSPITNADDLLRLGKAHADRSVQVAAQAATDALCALVDALVNAETRTEALAEVERLEAQLLAARERAGLNEPVARPPRLAAPGPDARTVREWATANGVPCPAVGRVPRRVVDLYNEAVAS